MDYEYKCVGGPERGKKAKSAKTRSDRVAVAMEEIIADEATDGWEYLRTDLVPVEEKTSFLPSGDQLGCSSCEVSVVTCIGLPPAVSVT